MPKGIPTPSSMDLWIRKLPQGGNIGVGGRLIEAAMKAGKLKKDIFSPAGTSLRTIFSKLAKMGIRVR